VNAGEKRVTSSHMVAALAEVEAGGTVCVTHYHDPVAQLVPRDWYLKAVEAIGVPGGGRGASGTRVRRRTKPFGSKSGGAGGNARPAKP
jgi:antitoxin (DNA-binding transcriptional repressor) of toxin-antitoxin stability system